MSKPVLRVLSHLPLHMLEQVSRAHPDVQLCQVPMKGAPQGDAEGEVLLTHARGSPNLAEVVKRGVRWVHTYGTGVNAFPFDALGDRLLTCSRGASAGPIAEWVMAMLLAAETELPKSWIHEPPTHWNIASLGGLRGRTLALVGLGGIGGEVARLSQAFGMKVRALRRTAAPSPIEGVEMARDFASLVRDADHLVLAVPATAATQRLIDAEALALVKPGVHIVNIARGELVDQDALRAALDDGRVSLASLDCVEPEPLPAGHWLYTHPKVRLSAHISWSAPGAFDGLIEPFVENLRRWRAGEELLWKVDRELGY
jgi:phosphoglycerate dehydrogenase-like enzyme